MASVTVSIRVCRAQYFRNIVDKKIKKPVAGGCHSVHVSSFVVHSLDVANSSTENGSKNLPA